MKSLFAVAACWWGWGGVEGEEVGCRSVMSVDEWIVLNLEVEEKD